MKQFSIRDLLFLVMIIALALGWWFDRRPVAGRFAMGGGDNHAYLFDTATGQVWEKAYLPNDTFATPGFYTPKTSGK
jgi:hypothetical protein